MGNYCNGSIYCTGPKDILQQLYVLTQRLDDCVAISEVRGDSDLLSYIFKEDYRGEGIFYEGGSFENNTLELYIRAHRTNGHDYFQAMASGLGITIKWQYVSDADDREYTLLCKPVAGAPRWEMRTEEELDAPRDGLSESHNQSFSSHRQTASPSFSANSSAYKKSRPIDQMSFLDPQASTEPPPANQDERIAELREAIYFHCSMAHMLAMQTSGIASPLQRTRITADLYMAAVKIKELASLTSKTVSSDFLAAIEQIYSVFGVSAGELQFNFAAKRYVDYSDIKRLSDMIIHFSLELMPEYAIMMVKLKLSYWLW